jgi:DNA processing protein
LLKEKYKLLKVLKYKIALTLIPNIGDITGKKLIAFCGGIDAVFKENKKSFLKIPGIGQQLVQTIIDNREAAVRKAEDEIKFIEKNNITPMFCLDDDYPNRLKHCIDGPLMLYSLGNADLNKQKIVAVVGTRRATEYGKEITNNLIKDLSDLDVMIVSGLAYGIDSYAHKAALQFNLPTVGVLAHGLDRIYPLANKQLAEKMQSNGGLVSDFISNTNPDRENFPKRNRIIAGLADAIIVVEAARKGGALITADIANSYNRDVFAVPGKIGDAYSQGCNYYIRTNRAALIESAQDIVYIMGWEEKKEKNKPLQKKLFVEFTDDERVIVEMLEKNGDSGIDFLCINSEMNSSKVASALLNLEFNGVVKSLPGKRYQLL